MRVAKILDSETDKFDNQDYELIKSGVPSKLGVGDRKLYTLVQRRPSLENLGLSGLFLLRGLGLYSYDSDLAGSYGIGRVVLFSAEGAQKFLRQYSTIFNSEKQRYYNPSVDLKTPIEK